ncbi:MAG: CDP-alcohol phosphatidyltransferase family protein [Thermoleophilia bacterium]|nr:CDP-alcohol phosphatidyltransferase family protein [Thermoleophilia bacterium]
MPVVIALVLHSEDGTGAAATAIFVGAALTDLLDGQIARRTGTVSSFGSTLDPLADRLLISGTIIALAIAGILPAIGVFLVAGRDILMIIGYKALKRRGIVIRVSPWGKAYTALFMVAIVAAMSGYQPGGFRLGWWLFWAGVAGSILIGFAYAVSGLGRLSRAQGPPKPAG